MNFKEFLAEASTVTVKVGIFDKSEVNSSYIKRYEKMFNIKLGKVSSDIKGVPGDAFDAPEASQTVTGSKEDVIKFLTHDEPYGYSLDEVKDYFPKLK